MVLDVLHEYKQSLKQAHKQVLLSWEALQLISRIALCLDPPGTHQTDNQHDTGQVRQKFQSAYLANQMLLG